MFDKISGSVPFKERPKAKELKKLVKTGRVKEIVLIRGSLKQDIEDYTKEIRRSFDK